MSVIVRFDYKVVCFFVFSSFCRDGTGCCFDNFKGVIDFKREPWPQISDNAKSLVRQMLEQDPRKQLTAQQVLGK